MIPVSPVLPRYPEIVFAKDQPQYLQLPAAVLGGREGGREGRIITRWRLSLYERLKVLLTGNIFLEILTFNKPLQPVRLGTEPSEAWK